MSLRGSDELVMLPLLNFEALLVVAIDHVPHSFLVDVLAPLSPQALHHLLERHVSAGLDRQAFLHCAVPQDPRHGLGELGVATAAGSSVLSSLHNSFIIKDGKCNMSWGLLIISYEESVYSPLWAYYYFTG